MFFKIGIDVKVEDELEKYGLSCGGWIFFYGVGENWWSCVGVFVKMLVGEIGGLDFEMFYDFDLFGDECVYFGDDGLWLVEIGNNVFMLLCNIEEGFVLFLVLNIDYGGGLECIFLVV